MKKIILTIIVTLNLNANVLETPKELQKWFGYIYNIKVQISDLGMYKGVENLDGEDFWIYEKTISDNTCMYPIRKDSNDHYLGTVYCR